MTREGPLGDIDLEGIFSDLNHSYNSYQKSDAEILITPEEQEDYEVVYLNRFFADRKKRGVRIDSQILHDTFLAEKAGFETSQLEPRKRTLLDNMTLRSLEATSQKHFELAQAKVGRMEPGSEKDRNFWDNVSEVTKAAAELENGQ